jgi:hypothetical protein
LNDDIAQLTALVMTRIIGDFKGRSPAPERLLELATEEARAQLAVQLIEVLAPAAPDHRIWDQWLVGGESPRAALEVAKFDPSDAPSSRKIKGATGHYSEARKKSLQARANLEDARAKLADAEQAARDAEKDEKRCAAMAQGAVIWAVLRAIADMSNAIFAMRAAGPILRAISPYPTEAASAWEAREAESERGVEVIKERYRKLREEEYRKLVEALDFFGGDVQFETDVRKALKEVVGFHDKRRPELEAKGRKSRSHGKADDSDRPAEMKAWRAIVDAVLAGQA